MEEVTALAVLRRDGFASLGVPRGHKEAHVLLPAGVRVQLVSVRNLNGWEGGAGGCDGGDGGEGGEGGKNGEGGGGGSQARS